MHYTPDSVDPDTIPRIDQARSLTGRQGEPPMVPYRNIGQILAERAAQQSDKPWLDYYVDAERESGFTYGEFYELVRRLASFMLGELRINAGREDSGPRAGHGVPHRLHLRNHRRAKGGRAGAVQPYGGCALNRGVAPVHAGRPRDVRPADPPRKRRRSHPDDSALQRRKR